MSATDNLTAAPVGAAAEPLPLRRNRDFRLLWTGTAFSSLGSQVSTFAYPLIVLWSGGSVSEAGLTGAAASLPQLLLSLFAGVMVDRFDRRRLMIGCNLGRAAALAVLVATMLSGRVILPLLLAVAFVEASLTVLYKLAEHSAVRNVVDPEHLSQAISQNEARVQGAGLLGQPLAGALSSLVAWLPLLFTVVSHLVSLITLSGIKRRFQAERTPAAERPKVLADISAGIKWLWNHRQLRAAAVLVAVSNMLFEVLVLGMLTTLRDDGAQQAVVGLVMGAAGIGGVAGALSTNWWMERLRLPVIVIGANALWTVLFPLAVFLKNPLLFGLVITPMSFIGAMWTIAVVSFQVEVTPDEMQGRIASVIGIVAFGTLPLGALIGGYTLQAFGFRASVLACSAVMLLLTLAAVASPSLRRIGSELRERAAATTEAAAAEPAAAEPAAAEPAAAAATPPQTPTPTAAGK
ncbi:MFS transporter [Kitasatospora sp. NPDC088346]|uniref:MFS transporter n=1 Tax=Kitasatospora sp. NPDC088346 TaxID=3364073 RepID=UPI003823804A